MNSNTETMELIRAECAQLCETLIRKNVNYGGVFQDRSYFIPVITPFTGCVIRLGDKCARLKTLLSGEPDTVGESLEDTLLDIAGYAILARIIRAQNAETIEE